MDIARWNSDKNPMCHRCTIVEETFQHVFQCKSRHADKTHMQALKKLKDGLRRSQTAPIIQRTIVQCIERHRKGYENLSFKDIIVDDDTKILAQKVFHNQDRLGNTALLQGFLSLDWSLLQNTYDGLQDVMNPRIDWAAKVVKHIWVYSTTMWKMRCEDLHGTSGKKTESAKRKDLLTLLELELERTRYFGDFEARQLRANIKRSMNNAQTVSLQLWLDTIRNIKESEIMLRRENQIRPTRMQSITRFLSRTADA